LQAVLDFYFLLVFLVAFLMLRSFTLSDAGLASTLLVAQIFFVRVDSVVDHVQNLCMQSWLTYGAEHSMAF
jgi:hypothetical protein